MISCYKKLSNFDHRLVDFKRVMHPDRGLPWKAAGNKPMCTSTRLVQIEEFVDLAIASDEPTYRKISGSVDRYELTKIGRRFAKVVQHLWFFDSNHDYSEKPYAFFQSVWEAENIFKERAAHITGSVNRDVERYLPILDWVVMRLRELRDQKFFDRYVSDRRYESSQRTVRIRELVTSLLTKHCKLLLVRFDLAYQQDQRWTKLMDDLVSDREKFFSLRDSHPRFHHLLGYAWAIEDGRQKGPHCHVLMIFNGSRLMADMKIAKNLKRIWDKDLLGGDGSAWNCNAGKFKRYKDIGIGMIMRSDVDAVAKAVYFATYLTKDPHLDKEMFSSFDGEKGPQYLRMRPCGARAFGISSCPEVEDRKGRPITKPITWSPSDMAALRWPYRETLDAVINRSV